LQSYISPFQIGTPGSTTRIGWSDAPSNPCNYVIILTKHGGILIDFLIVSSYFNENHSDGELLSTKPNSRDNPYAGQSAELRETVSDIVVHEDGKAGEPALCEGARAR
jgi:hypothetical protein